MNICCERLHSLKLIRNSFWFLRKIESQPLSSTSRVRAYSSSADASGNGLLRKHYSLKPRKRLKYPSLPASDGPTIYALSTAPGRAAIAIIRISGPACLGVYRALCYGQGTIRPRHATLRTLYEPPATSEGNDAKQVLDSNALVLYFPAPQTATGDDILELHIHGGTAVVKAVLAAIPKAIPDYASQPIRYAEPGEFTRRAFYNNRLNLLQVEALGNILAADTEQQRQLAVRGMGSALAQRFEAWRQMLLHARGELEALIDFAEDQQFDESHATQCASVAKRVQELKTKLQAHVENASRGEVLRNGINVALIGAPNAGKSSLLNQIVGREAAIVNSEAGTTRDVVDVNVDIRGFFCRFGDLAGLRDQTQPSDMNPIGEVEKEGIARAKKRALEADVVVVVLSPEVVEGSAGSKLDVSINSEVHEVLRQVDINSQKVVCVLNKADLFGSNAHLSNTRSKVRQDAVLRDFFDFSETPVFAVSCTNAQASNIDNKSDPSGIQTFLDALTQIFSRMTATVIPEGHDGHDGPIDSSLWAESLGATERQRLLLQQCLQHLENFLATVPADVQSKGVASGQDDDPDVVVAAESLRVAADCLAKITGKGESGDVEEVLGVVFEK